MDKHTLGWDDFFEQSFQDVAPEGTVWGRVTRENRGQYAVRTETDECVGEISGAFRYAHTRQDEYPSVGDWVVVEPVPGESKVRIVDVLPRRTVFKRASAGRTSEEQVVAANVDVVFLVSGLDHDYNPRRIERFITLAYESGAKPVVVLNKADLAEEQDERLEEIADLAKGLPVEIVSATDGKGIDALRGYVESGKTAAFLGSSGVGKSTLINSMLGEAMMATGDVREDDSRGRHTTTHRQLVRLPSGGMLIDTPGMREIQMTGHEESVGHTFSDVEELSALCKFRDCQHEGESGCAIAAALESGELAADRYEAYLKLQREMAYSERKLSESRSFEERRRTKDLTKMYKRVQKQKRRF